MASGLQATKRRIRSISATRKITKAMELVATAKLRRYKNKLAGVKVYTDEVINMTAKILVNSTSIDSKYFTSNGDDSTLYVIITSNLGLCGGYNSNIFKLVTSKIDKSKDKLFVVGQKGINYFKNRNFNILLTVEDDALEYQVAQHLSKEALKLYVNKSINKVKFVYTNFVNSVTFQPVILDLLPVNADEIKVHGSMIKKDPYTVFEPDAISVIDMLIPFYFEASIYGRLIESKVSEQASRRISMENASDNADELKEKLLLEYNKERQSAITQEISEVVSSANAL